MKGVAFTPRCPCCGERIEVRATAQGQTLALVRELGVKPPTPVWVAIEPYCPNGCL